MSDGKEVKRWWTRGQYDNDTEVVSAKYHDRIMSERDELWKRATKFVMPGEMDTGESIEHYIKTLEQTVAELRAEVEKHNALHEYATKAVEQLKARIDNQAFILSENTKTIATQARVIEKLKSYAKHRVDCICRAGVLEYSEECDCGLKAIEQQGEGT